MKTVEVGGMSEAGYGVNTLKTIQAEKLGTYTVLFRGPWDLGQLRQVVDFCKANGMRFVMDETFNRLSGDLWEPYATVDLDEYNQLIAEAGGHFDGSLFMCEFGGMMLYWPPNFVMGSPNVISKTDCALAAKNEMLGKLRQLIKKSAGTVVIPPMICIEAAGGMAKYLYEAGMDRVDLEVIYDRFTEFSYSAIKGAAIAYDKMRFGVDLAMVWYGGNSHDELWFKRWQTSLYHAFIRGADPIYAEHGLMDYKALGKELGTNAPEVQTFRAKLGNFAAFAARHPRPAGFPEARIAVISGNLDSFALGQPSVWGQRGEGGVKSGSPEHSWELFNTFYQKIPWEYRYATGTADYSANPPLGQVDVIPADSPVAVLKRYNVLIFLGWNTMTPGIYGNLKAFVSGGGHLLCTLAHLCVNTVRGESPRLINTGDLRDLFGVAVETMDQAVKVGVKFKANPSKGNYRFPLWSAVCDPKYDDGGFPAAGLRLEGAELLAVAAENFGDQWDVLDHSPVLTANTLGQGMAFLVNSLEYPGYHGMRRFYQDLLRFFAAAWQNEFMVESSDRIRFAVYHENGMAIIYLLNTDPSCRQEARLFAGPTPAVTVMLDPGELRVCYRAGNCLAIPADHHSRITALRRDNNTMLISLYEGRQAVPAISCFEDGRNWDGQVVATAHPPARGQGQIH